MRRLLHKITTAEQRTLIRRLTTKPIKHMSRYLSLLAFWSHYPEKKFLVFAEGRGGTSLLVNLLNSHPDIYCDGEIFHRRNYKITFPQLYLDSRSRITRLNRKPVYGFKVKLTQLVFDQEFPESFIKGLYDDGWKIIYLRRNNFLKASLSTVLARERGLYHITTQDSEKESNKLRKIKIDCEELYNMTKGREQFAKIEMDWLKGTDYFVVSYEDDLLDSNKHQQTLDKIFRFLEISRAKVSTHLRRTSSGDLSQDIANYDEVKRYFRTTEFTHFLDSD